MGLLDELLDARLAEKFDESKIRRDPRGKFADKPDLPALPGSKLRRTSGGSGRPSEAPRASAPSAPSKLAGRSKAQPPRAPGAGAGERTASGGGRPKMRKLTEEELPKRVGRGVWSANAERTAKDLLAGRVEDTENAHRERLPDGSLGPYSAERAKLHERIVDLLMRHAREHPGEARAVFLAGGPASGKSSLLSSGDVTLPADAVDVNPDIVRSMLPEYRRLVEAGDPAAAAKTHEEASHLSKVVMNLALERQHHVVVDGVGGGSPGKFAKKIAAARDAGLAVEVNYVSIPTEEAVRRAEKRAARSGRHVPLGYLRSAHAEVSARFADDVSSMPGVRVRVFDNAGKAPKLIAEKSAEERAMQVKFRREYEAFVKKARRDAGQDV